MTVDSITEVTPRSDIVDRFQPEPKIGGSGFFQQALNALGGAAATGAGLLSGDNAALIQLQLETQKQMMYTSMISNIEKSKHETQMAPVRNIRVG